MDAQVGILRTEIRHGIAFTHFLPAVRREFVSVGTFVSHLRI